jgi:hypothetical protein
MDGTPMITTGVFDFWKHRFGNIKHVDEPVYPFKRVWIPQPTDTNIAVICCVETTSSQSIGDKRTHDSGFCNASFLKGNDNGIFTGG